MIAKGTALKHRPEWIFCLTGLNLSVHHGTRRWTGPEHEGLRFQDRWTRGVQAARGHSVVSCGGRRRRGPRRVGRRVCVRSVPRSMILVVKVLAGSKRKLGQGLTTGLSCIRILLPSSSLPRARIFLALKIVKASFRPACLFALFFAFFFC